MFSIMSFFLYLFFEFLILILLTVYINGTMVQTVFLNLLKHRNGILYIVRVYSMLHLNHLKNCIQYLQSTDIDL